MKAAALAGMAILLGLLVLPVLTVVAAFGAAAGSRPPPPPSGFTVDGIPPAALDAYRAAAATCPGLSWTVLAGIGEVESDHGQSALPGVHTGANSFGAEGPMQFLPATFAEYAVARADGQPPSPYDPVDATMAAAKMLCANGAGDPATLPQAIWDYNHSWEYVATVLGWAQRYATTSSTATAAMGEQAAAWALKQVGLPYAWGAAGPDAYDCSGLVLRAWQSVGVTVARVAADQYGAGAHLPLADARPGDLVFFASDPSDPSTIDHVGIYLGNGQMVDAPHAGTTVQVAAIYPEGLVPDVTRPWATSAEPAQAGQRVRSG